MKAWKVALIALVVFLVLNGIAAGLYFTLSGRSSPAIGAGAEGPTGA